MIDGVLLGIMTWLSLSLSWLNLPKKIKTFMLSHHLLTDLCAGLLTFFFLSSISKSLIAVIGAAISSLLVNFSLITYEWWSTNGNLSTEIRETKN